jgi:hypothetical protein
VLGINNFKINGSISIFAMSQIYCQYRQCILGRFALLFDSFQSIYGKRVPQAVRPGISKRCVGDDSPGLINSDIFNGLAKYLVNPFT